jgi:ubiquinone/menaquinone biosynthesis C-methylase UbiE
MGKAGQKGDKRESKYAFGYKYGIVDYLRFRGKRSADFVLPHLRPGMRLLDCGCGPGTITIELAKAVAPGEVIGIDLEVSQIDIAQNHARELGMTNLKFEVVDLLKLTYPDECFDAAFTHAVLVHLADPVAALDEIYRVLRSGGMIAVREPIMDKAIFSPEDPLLIESFELILQALKHCGGDGTIGHRLRPLLREAGFEHIQLSASWEQPSSLDEWPQFYEGWSQVFSGNIANIILEQGWSDKGCLNQIVSAWKNFGENKTGFAASPWVEAVGRKI